MKAGFTPVTSQDRTKGGNSETLWNQGHRAVQLPLLEQPMLHPPTAPSATAFLPTISRDAQPYDRQICATGGSASR